MLIHDVKRIAVINQEKRREIICEILDEIGVKYTLQQSTMGYHKPINIIVSYGVDSPDLPRYVLGAHYDSVTGSTGANDNASGVSVLLAIIRVFQVNLPPIAIDIVFFDLEEGPMAGSRAYLKHVSPEKIQGMINADLCGYGDNIIYALGRGSIGSTLASAIKTISDAYPNIVETPLLPPADDLIFQGEHIPAVCICAIPITDIPLMEITAPILHQHGVPDSDKIPTIFKTMHNGSTDSIASVSEESLQLVKKIVIELIKSL